MVVDILVQMNAHNKKCALDIQDYQRSLGIKMRVLDEFTTGAVQELSNVHQQAKTHADHLLSGKGYNDESAIVGINTLGAIK